MTTDPFTDPASPTAVEYPDLHGSLLMLEVLGYEDHIPTAYTEPGEKNPAVRATITVLDGRNAGRIYEDALVFPRMLIGQLRSRVGKIVLGRLGQGEASPGKTAPWKLEAATDQDKARAREALASSRMTGPASGGSAAPPPPPQQAPQQTGWQPTPQPSEPPF